MTVDISKFEDTTTARDAFPDIFVVPEVYGAKWTAIYNDLVAKLRSDASGLPMNSAQVMLIERIAATYVRIRVKEQDDTLGAALEKDLGTRYLSYTQEFNKTLASNEEKVLSEKLIKIQGIVLEAMEKISDKEERQQVRRQLAADFADLDV